MISSTVGGNFKTVYWGNMEFKNKSGWGAFLRRGYSQRFVEVRVLGGGFNGVVLSFFLEMGAAILNELPLKDSVICISNKRPLRIKIILSNAKMISLKVKDNEELELFLKKTGEADSSIKIERN